ISVIDTTTNQQIDANPSIFSKTIRVGSRPSGLAISPDGGAIYVTNQYSNSLSIINASTLSAVASISVGMRPSSIAISSDGMTLYIANANDRITVVDTVTRRVETVAASSLTGSRVPTLALSPDGNVLYLGDEVRDAVHRIAVVRGNTAPTIEEGPSLGEPDNATGAITGSLHVTDHDGDALSYVVVGQPKHGAVTIDTTGTFTYTPKPDARQSSPSTVDVNSTADSFTIRISDAHTSTTVTVTVPVITAGQVLSTPYLPFDMVVTATPQKVFAHYVPWMPISIDNLPSETDYYTVHLMNPDGENGIHARYGGYMRNRPMPRDPISGTDWRYQDALTDVNQARSVGIDGFTVDITNTTLQDQAVRNLLRAAEATPGFSIQPQADLASDTIAGMTPTQFAAAFAPYLAADGAFRLSDGRVVLSAFYAERKSTAWWDDALGALRKTYELDVAFVPTFLHAHLYMTAFAPISYGFGNWGGRNPSTVDPDNPGFGAQVGLVRDAHALGKIFMQPVAFQDNRPRSGLFEEPFNSQTNANGWEIAVNEGAEWVQLVTWNDYAEGTAMAPSVQHGWKMLDMQAFNIAQFKYGSDPTLVRDALYVSHRSQLADSVPSYDTSFPMQTVPGSPAAVDNVEVVVFTTAPATVRATIGGITSTCAVGAGRSVCNFDLRPGEVIVSLERAGNVQALVHSPFRVTDSPYIQNMDYHMAGGLR
ncbi:endo-1,3-alpha-glucanase family glycosylhydrolase, partial [Mycobacterium sp. pV006]|uniref:endo-1,3-alpha-glucanase family glycosylhydrolase n=1 Tax=Mycobacterium sp. pV006 TaxID=3238983 RepID=UPI00351B3A59